MNSSHDETEQPTSHFGWSVIRLQKAVEFLEIPGKVIGFGVATYTFVGFIFWPFVGWLPIWSLYSAWAILALIGASATVFGLYRWPSGKRWIAVVLVIATTAFAIVFFLWIPPEPQWEKVNVINLARHDEPLPPPVNIIESVAWGREFPGGTPFRGKVQMWRKPGGYEQWMMYTSTKLTPNRLPKSIRLRDESLDAALAAYVFSDWRIDRMVGFDDRYTTVDFKPIVGFGADYYVVVFVFPFSREAAGALEGEPNEVFVF